MNSERKFKFHIGLKVEVVSPEKGYSRFVDFFEDWDLRKKFVKGRYTRRGIYRIIERQYVPDASEKILYGLLSLDEKDTYVIGERGIIEDKRQFKNKYEELKKARRNNEI